MSCGTLSLLTKVTWPPTPTVDSSGSSPNAVIETRAVAGGEAGSGAGEGTGAGDGTGAATTGVGFTDVDGALELPQPANSTTTVIAHAPGNRISGMVTLTPEKGGDVRRGATDRGRAANRVPEVRSR